MADTRYKPTSPMRFRLLWWRGAILRAWYRYVHGVQLGWNASHQPALGDTPFCSVKRHGSIIDVRWKVTDELIRIIPWRGNHGVFIEYTDASGQVTGRTVADFTTLKNMVALPREANR